MSTPLDLLAARAPQTDQALLASIERGLVPSAPLAAAQPQAVAEHVSEDFFNASSLSSTSFNRYFQGVQTDLIRLFAGSNDNDGRIAALEKLGVDQLGQLAATLDALESRIQATADLQLGYDAGFTIYSRVDFIDDSAIERDRGLTGGLPAVNYDPRLQAVTMGLVRDVDTLHISTGSEVVDVQVDLQLGLPVSAYSHLRTPAHAIDNSDSSYWSEVVLADAPLSVPWPPPGSKYGPAVAAGALTPLAGGAVCELTLTYRQPQSWDQLVIKPFCELPINLAAVFCVKRDGAIVSPGAVRLGNAEQTGYGRYLLTEYSSARTRGLLLLNQTARLFFPIQEEVLSVTLVFHQPHYTREVFALPASTAAGSVLWDQMLGNTPLLGLPGADGLDLTYHQNPTDVLQNLSNSVGSTLAGTLTRPDPAVHTHTKFQYVYGAYDIALRDRRYAAQSVFVSAPLTSRMNLMQGTLVADYDVPMLTPTFAQLFAGDRTMVPPGFKVPAATVKFELTFGGGQPWYPFVPLGDAQAHEAIVFPTNLGATPAYVFPATPARPGSPVIVTSFDGLGHAQIIFAGVAPSVTVQQSTGIYMAGNQLAQPGYYCLSYTPLDTSHWVDFGSLAEAGGAVTQKTVTFTGAVIPQLAGLQLPSEPYVDPNRIHAAYEPNGNPQTEYVPTSVTIDNLPVSFPVLVDSTGHARTISSYAQDLSHAQGLFTVIPVALETLYASSGNTAAAQIFTASKGKWSRLPAHTPQVFSIAPNAAPVAIAPVDGKNNTVYTVDYTTGTISFQGDYAASSGQIAVTYWYESTVYDVPRIVNRTDFSGLGAAALTPFDPKSYPVLEYVSVDDKIYFNLDLPATARVTVVYHRLFDSVRVRATLTRTDPSSAAVSPHLYGYTFLARDANGTSLPANGQPLVVWGDLELETLGTTTQNNPGIGLIAGNTQSSGGLPVLTQFNWYRIVNAGSVVDTLRTSYDASNGTTVFWDFTAERFIPPDGGQSRELTYRVMNVDGSNTITLSPGDSVVLGIANFLVPPGTPQSINAAIVYSGQNADFLQTKDWLLQAVDVTKATSIASVVIS